MGKDISEKQMDEIAILAKLELTAAEQAQAKRDMRQMLDYMEVLNELNTSGTEPMTHVFPLQNVFREDVSRPGADREEILKNAPKVKKGCYQVPKTIK